ncbi:hypothetical protein MTR67_014997, partial [Solanum verrucosum]
GSKKVKERSLDKAQANSKVSALFGGTQDKFVACKKTVYPLEKWLLMALRTTGLVSNVATEVV